MNIPIDYSYASQFLDNVELTDDETDKINKDIKTYISTTYEFYKLKQFTLTDPNTNNHAIVFIVILEFVLFFYNFNSYLRNSIDSESLNSLEINDSISDITYSIIKSNRLEDIECYVRRFIHIYDLSSLDMICMTFLIQKFYEFLIFNDKFIETFITKYDAILPVLVILSRKLYLDDTYYINKYYSDLAEVNVKDIYDLEIFIVVHIDLYVEPEDFKLYKKSLDQQCAYLALKKT